MGSVANELPAVLLEAAQAQELEDEQHWSAAADVYYRAACQLSYMLDMHIDKDKESALAELLCGLHSQYERRISVLRSRTAAAEEAQWVQMERCSAGANLHQLDEASRASTSFATGFNGSACRERDLQATMVANGAGGMQSRSFSPDTAGEESQDPQCAIELLRLCQRTVSGSLDDVVGLEDVKEEIEEAVFLPLQHPYLFNGIRQPAKTFLLYGPPGTGKTMLVEKVAAEAEFSLLSISPSMILSKWAGDSEKAVSQVFDLARTMQPSILFLDEVDSLGQSRDSNSDAGARRLLTELLIQFNKVAEQDGVYIFAATNRMQDCDPALLRRFSRRIEVPLPSELERHCFFQAMLSRPEVAAELSQQDVQQLAQQTSGYSGSDLAAVCRLAVMAPVRELFREQRQQQGPHARKRCRLNDTHQEAAVDQGGLEPAGDDSQAAADGDAGVGLPAAKKMLQLRSLVLADFQAALKKVAPAAVDAQHPQG
ncbi:hypothetical protein OEZ85_010687 [Tetradesmus obliquus]|uniref:AAA+ ATPase domain-containing protein n=1 Tax=Tetradesmus obliquus TaxID=3088 RepID=A0ABY8TN18_TETOB|nr:hypothetical protein OEZ85_010687 [Tetradesmus obliquus]